MRFSNLSMAVAISLPVVCVVVKMRFVSPSGLTSNTCTLYLRPGRRSWRLTDVVDLGRSVFFLTISFSYIFNFALKSIYLHSCFYVRIIVMQNIHVERFSQTFLKNKTRSLITLTDHLWLSSVLRELVFHSESRYGVGRRHPWDHESARGDLRDRFWGVHNGRGLGGLALCSGHWNIRK